MTTASKIPFPAIIDPTESSLDSSNIRAEDSQVQRTNLRQLNPAEEETLRVILTQHWENARNIKDERLYFTNIYALISAGILSLLNAVRGEGVVENSLLIFLLSLSVIGLLTSLRLKAELEECLCNIEQIVIQMRLEEFMPVVDSRGALTRYPQFRWLFPVFYSICAGGILVLLLVRLTGVWRS